jgi:hypothetical protein
LFSERDVEWIHFNPLEEKWQNSLPNHMTNSGLWQAVEDTEDFSEESGNGNTGVAAAPANITQATLDNWLSEFDTAKTVKRVKNNSMLDEKDNSVLKSFYSRKTEFAEKVKGTFKPNGVAATTIGQLVAFVDEILATLTHVYHDKKAYEKEYVKMQNKYYELQSKYDKTRASFAILESTHFDIKKFSKFCDNLYKTVDIPGPKIREMADLPQLTDFMYTQIVKHQPQVDEVP